MSEHSSGNKRLAKNTFVLYFRLLFTMAIQLYTSRLILQALGVEDYGIYNVVGGVVILLNSVNASLSNANSRFIAVELGLGRDDSIRKLFSCIMSIHYLFALIILLVAETGGLWFVTNKLVIPESRMVAALWVYQSAVFASIITIISSPYNGLIIAHERMSAFAVISVFDAIAKLFVAFFLFISPFDRLIIYAVLIVIIQLIVRLIYTTYCNRQFKESRYRLIWDKDISKGVLSFAGWTLTGNVAVIGSTQGLNILLNIFFGAVVNAARGIAVQVQGALRMFVNGFQTAINPQILKAYAKKDIQRMQILINVSSRFSYFIMLIITIPMWLNTQYILSLWLGDVPDYTAAFVQVMLCIGLINTLQNPTMTALHATGEIKRVQLVESFMLISVIPIAYIGLKWLHISPVMVLCVYLFVEFFTQFVRVVMIYPMVNMKIGNYITKVFIPITLVTFFSVLFCIVLSCLYEVTNFFNLIVISLANIFITLIIIMIFGVKRSERNYMIHYIKNKFQFKKKLFYTFPNKRF